MSFNSQLVLGSTKRTFSTRTVPKFTAQTSISIKTGNSIRICRTKNLHSICRGGSQRDFQIWSAWTHGPNRMSTPNLRLSAVGKQLTPAPSSLFRQVQQKRDNSTMASTNPSLSVVSTTDAPSAIGPYSQAIKAGDLLFCSGCIPLDPATMEVVTGGVEAQTERALANLKAVVEAGGSELGKVVKTTVFLKSMNDFVAVNGIYAKFFGNHKPARSAVEVARLPKDVLVEVECIASLT